MKKTVFAFSGIIIALLVLFQVSTYYYATGDLSIEILIAAIAVIFLFLGIYLHKKSLHKPHGTTLADPKQLIKLGISKREYEVLIEIAKGLSNKEIAAKLFVTKSTIKSYVSNLLVKLASKRRTQAIKKAKELQILPS